MGTREGIHGVMRLHQVNIFRLGECPNSLASLAGSNPALALILIIEVKG